jgi:perosamine synthetase
MWRLAPLRRATPAAKEGRFYFWSGRAALYALLRALRVGPSDEVIVPVYTCPAVIEPILGLGARAVYCDIEMETFGLDPAEAAAAITGRTKAVIVQHTFGIPASVNGLAKLTRDRGASMLEDCCHVSSSAYRGQPLGQLGDAAFYSHDWDKPLSVGGGGVAVVNSPLLREAVAETYPRLANLGFGEGARVAARSGFISAKKLARICLSSLAAGPRTCRQEALATDPMPSPGHRLGPEYDKRMPRLFERRLHRIIDDPSRRVSARKRAVRRYEDAFRSLGIECLKTPEGCDAVLWRYPLLAADKPKLLQEARRHGAKLTDWGTIPLRSLTTSAVGDDSCKRRFPVAENVARRLVTLHIDERVSGGEVERTLEFLSRMKNRGLL